MPPAAGVGATEGLPPPGAGGVLLGVDVTWVEGAVRVAPHTRHFSAPLAGAPQLEQRVVAMVFSPQL
ncbi:MAG: hypothetical protein D6681_19830 [Calditrichaeota bacterium]|nr:MAG: hypothetical protein D6681_19830 [Calditrichota bacterium]